MNLQSQYFKIIHIIVKDAAKNEKTSAMEIIALHIAHDIRDSLSIISVCQENLRILYDIDEIKQKQMDKISHSVNKINEIIQEVLNFAKIENIQYVVSTNTMLLKIVSSMNALNEIKIQLSKKDIVINCDRSKIGSVFSNLISNSIQVIKRDGKIIVNEDVPNKICFTFEGSGILDLKKI